MTTFSRSGSFAAAIVLCALEARAATPPPGFVDSVLVASGLLSFPVGAAFEPGTDNLYIIQKGGSVRVKSPTGVTTALALPCVDSPGERGLLGIAFSPNYLDPSGESRFVYLFYTRLFDNGACRVPGTSAGTRFRVSRFEESSMTLSGEHVILEGPPLTGATNHNAGTLRFASDGTLFVSTGDNDTDHLANPLSRNLNDLRGKLLRIHEDGSTPVDNPFVGQAGVREEIWAWGLRNPFRFSYDDDTDTVYIGDVGQNSWEAVYAGVAGADYGYPCVEGSAPFRACNPAPPPGSVTSPIYEYDHSVGESITGGPVYRATAFPEEYHDNYFFGDFVDDWIRRGRFAEDGRLVDVEIFIPNATDVVDILVAPTGCLIWVSLTNGVHQTCYEGGTNAQPQAVAFADPVSGLSSLNVQFTGSPSDDPDGDALSFDWDFGDTSSSTLADPSHSYTANGVYQAVLTVDDQQAEVNSTDTAPPIRVVVGNRSPLASIDLPLPATSYNAGDAIAFSGSADDPEDGALGGASMSWTIVFHHDTHTHPSLGPIDGVSSGGFTIPTSGEDATNVFFRIHLTVTDSGSPLGANGKLSTSTFTDITPNLTDVTLAAEPSGAGLELAFDQQPAAAPFTRQTVVSFPRTIGAPSPQTIGDVTYDFDAWSDLGAAEHVVLPPAAPTTYTATFRCMLERVHDASVATTELIDGCDAFEIGPSYVILANGNVTIRHRESVTFVNAFTVEEGGELAVERVP